MASNTIYSTILAQTMPGELSPDLIQKLVSDIALMARNLSPKKMMKWLAWYLHGVATARCFKAMTTGDMAEATHGVALRIHDQLRRDVYEVVSGKPAA